MMAMNLGILLAPKRVQLQYTRTKNTRALKQYGILDGRLRSVAGSSPPAVSFNQADVSRSSSRKGSEQGKHEKEPRNTDTARDWGAGGTESNVSMNISTHAAAAPPNLSPPLQSDRFSLPSSPQDAGWSNSSGRNLSDASVSGASLVSDGTSSTRDGMSPNLPGVSASLEISGIDNIDFEMEPYQDDIEPEVNVNGPSTRRAEQKQVYGTIEGTYFETLRARKDAPEQGGVSVFRRILGFGRDGGQGLSRPPHNHHQGSVRAIDRAAPIASSFAPPWMTMAPRSRQEQEREIAKLDESFKDVGLMPANERRKAWGRLKSIAGLIGIGRGSDISVHANRKKRRGGVEQEDALNFVPDDGLFMLVPLWPKETEAAFGEPAEPFQPPIDQRQFLIVYYHPLEETKQDRILNKDTYSGKLALDDDLRVRNELEGASLEAPSASHDLSQLSGFHVRARLVGYDQLRTSGVRVPSWGLSVTGRLRDAAAAIPLPEVRARDNDPVVIAR